MKNAVINLNKIKKIHFTGIKGVGMTALALCAKDLGIGISGSDVEEHYVTDEILSRAKINWCKGFSQTIDAPDLLIYTAAHQGEENIEVITAKKKDIPVLSHAQALGLFMKEKEVISVSGVGGKTTTAAMISTIFETSGLKPSFAIGAGMIRSLAMPGKYDKEGKYFIAEADEYFSSPQDPTPRFLYQKPLIIVITNIEFDHPDVYNSLDETLKAFKAFVKKLPKNGLLVCNLDNLNIQKLLQMIKVPVLTYGNSVKADFHISSVKQEKDKTIFSVSHKGSKSNYEINIPGRFNVLNALASIVVSKHCHLKDYQIKAGLKKFKGVKRRFEYIWGNKEISFYDDYAHHPTEIKAVLKAAKIWFKGKRTIVIFQPHTYSRTKILLKDFSTAFVEADLVIITDIYSSAREKKDPAISGKILAEKISQNQNRVYYKKDVYKVGDLLKNIVRPGDVIFTLGAGDIFNWHRAIINNLE